MTDEGPRRTLAATDLAIDHTLAQLSASFQFILDVTPTNAQEEREAYLSGKIREPEFEYRELDTDPEVVLAQLDQVVLDAVEDATLAHLVRSKHEEMTLQAQMLAARGSKDFRFLSVELYGAVSPTLLLSAEKVLDTVSSVPPTTERVDADEFLAIALAEIDRYASQAPDARMFAEIREGVQGVIVSQDTLLIGPDTHIDAARVNALLQHEVGTHLVTRANGQAQPLRLLGVGLANFDETQEGLAVLAEIACGELTAQRLRQLAARVVAVHLLLDGAEFAEAVTALVDRGVPESPAFNTTMRVYRGGGFTKDAVYLRGLVDLLRHIGDGGELEPFWLGKFALNDLPLVADFLERGILHPPALSPRYLSFPRVNERLEAAASLVDDLPALLDTTARS